MAPTNRTYDPSCMDDFDPGSLDAEQALRQIIDAVDVIPETKIVPIREALGCSIVEEIQSKINVPGHTNSAMDGYAISGAELPAQGQQAFLIVIDLITWITQCG